MTELEKSVYNCWLATTRSKCGKPFRLRKDWTGFEDRVEYRYVKKVANILMRHDNIDMKSWFESPYGVYQEIVAYDLQFYTTMKAFKCYKIYKDKHNKK